MSNPSPRWSQLVDVHTSDNPGGLKDVVQFVSRARGYHCVILLGAAGFSLRYRDLVIAAVLKALPGRKPRVLITDATWERHSRALSRRFRVPDSILTRLSGALTAAIDGPHVHYAVLSTDELTLFPETWGVDPARVVFTPFPATARTDTPTTDAGHVFAGGNSLRDYDMLEEALVGTGLRAVVAARWSPAKPAPNISAGPIPHQQFVAELSSCRASVVPLQDSVRSAGQQSYLNAMLLGKPVIVTEAPGVRDYIEDGVTGVIVPPRAEALREALVFAMDPAQQEWRRDIGRRASAAVHERFLPGRYFDDTLLGAAGVPVA